MARLTERLGHLVSGDEPSAGPEAARPEGTADEEAIRRAFLAADSIVPATLTRRRPAEPPGDPASTAATAAVPAPPAAAPAAPAPRAPWSTAVPTGGDLPLTPARLSRQPTAMPGAVRAVPAPPKATANAAADAAPPLPPQPIDALAPLVSAADGAAFDADPVESDVPDALAGLAGETGIVAGDDAMPAIDLPGATASTEAATEPATQAAAIAGAAQGTPPTDNQGGASLAPVALDVPAVAMKRAPGATAPDELLEVSGGLKAASDDFFGGIKARAERRP